MQFKRIINHLKGYGEHADNHIGQCQIGNEQIGDGLHLAGGGHDPDDQRVADNRQDADRAVQHGQYDEQCDRYIVQLFCARGFGVRVYD